MISSITDRIFTVLSIERYVESRWPYDFDTVVPLQLNWELTSSTIEICVVSPRSYDLGTVTPSRTDTEPGSAYP
jgi:hypothetical protein